MRAPSACSAAPRPPMPGCFAHGPVGETTLLPHPERMPVQRAAGLLPSRAADNLFWVGRYVERAEATLRLVRAVINRFAEADDAAAPVMSGIGTLLDAWSAIPEETHQASAVFMARAALTRSRPGRIVALSGRRRAVRCLRHPRPLLAGCVAGDQRSRHPDRRSARRSVPPKARWPSGSKPACVSSPRSPDWRRRT